MVRGAAERGRGGAARGPAADGGRGAWPVRRGARRGGPGAQAGGGSDSPLCLEPEEPLVPLGRAGGRGREPRRGGGGPPALGSRPQPAAGTGRRRSGAARSCPSPASPARGEGAGSAEGLSRFTGELCLARPPAASGDLREEAEPGRGLPGAVETRGGRRSRRSAFPRRGEGPPPRTRPRRGAGRRLSWGRLGGASPPAAPRSGPHLCRGGRGWRRFWGGVGVAGGRGCAVEPARRGRQMGRDAAAALAVRAEGAAPRRGGTEGIAAAFPGA